MKLNRRIDSPSIANAFLLSAGAVLLALGLVGVFSFCVRTEALQPHDPLFALTLRSFSWIVSGMGFAVAMYCLFGKSAVLRTGLVLWFALNLLVYRIGMDYSGVSGGLSGYIGGVSDAFGTSRGVVNRFLEITVLYLLCGSLLVVALSWWVGRQERLHPSVKMFCWSCGLHIRFPIQDLGMTASCPNCRQPVTLRKPENLKMSCFFCQGHIEFPAHAIGTKMHCPHCNMDITLKEAV